ncbi:MAG: PQQ-dependent sugar dehydrogenase [Acidobacteriia bacterium]|nr:PQQ-dependent sugar dehydrogenase [Terriglobia bacterium]
MTCCWRRALALTLLAAPACACAAGDARSDRLRLDTIRLPAGFAIDLYAGGVRGARSMALGDAGTLFVASRAEGAVYAVATRGGAAPQGRVRAVVRGFHQPDGVAFRDGALFVAEPTRVLRLDAIESRLDDPPAPAVVRDDLPARDLHASKVLRFGPDGWLYVSIGVPCDRCEPDDPRFGTIARMRPDGTGLETFARGIRNSVGFDWHPATHELWFTDNGIDLLGENLPPEELNRAARAGLHFGYPYCHAQSIPDPFFAAGHDCAAFEPAAAALGPHVVPLGLRFYTGRQFPPEYRGQIFIAEHGSTNRTAPLGYRLTRVRLDGHRPVEYGTFADGWLQGRHAWGRPVDVLVMPDGALLVSDDLAGAIYRISYRSTSGALQGS